jgi:hypothetical protein
VIRIVQEADEVRFEGNADELRALARDITRAAEQANEDPCVLRCMSGKRKHTRVVFQKGETVHSL